MEKKWFVALLMVVVMVCTCWTGAVAEDEEREMFTSGDYEYALLDDGTVEITKYNGQAEKLTILDTLNGKKVTSISDYAFFNCNSLLSIIIPDSVAKISANPFAYCATLKSIFISPEHPYFFAIDGVLFRKADKCLISYPKGKESTTYNIPQGITAIGNSAFCDCNLLISVAIPDSVISIEDSAFYRCSSLTSITIPDSVAQIGMNPFACCSNLKNISTSPDHPYFAAIDGVLFRKADKTLISYPAGIKSLTYAIPQGITAIGDFAFYLCSSLTSVTIPDSVASIGNRTFYGCASLTNVSIPDSVISIGDSAFYGCSSLSSVTIPDSVTSIGGYTFAWCSSLTSISIPDFVTSIGSGAFSSCSSLTSISIPDSVTVIGNSAFSWCKSLTSVTIPNSVTFIGDNAFSGCPTTLTLIVPRNSYAAEYAKTNNIPYTYPDANDWLNN